MVSWVIPDPVHWEGPSLGGMRRTGSEFGPFTRAYFLSSPGSVDANGVTRIDERVNLGKFWRDRGARNGFTATVDLIFTSGDVAGRPSSSYVLTASMFVVKASEFPDGHVPPPSEILSLPSSKVQVYRPSAVTDIFDSGPDPTVTSASSAGTYHFVIVGAQPEVLETETKYWVLVCPTYVADPVPSLINDIPIGDPNVNGRALSLWTNRRPQAPVITSPSPNTLIGPGGEVTFTFVPKDPDQFVALPGDYDYVRGPVSDIAGVQIQYAPQPTEADPDPEWTDLPIASTDPFPTLGPGWFIEWSDGNNPLDSTEGAAALMRNHTMKIRAGSGTLKPGYGVLPTGDWQIRVRTFDYGHPFGTVFFVGYVGGAGPLGTAGYLSDAGVSDDGPFTPYSALDPDIYPEKNTSPWSEPVFFSVSDQVPAPIPITPTQGLAKEEGTPVRMSWQYRNTRQPPRSQYRRAIQIRKSGDVAWSTVFDGYSSENFVDLPMSIVQPSYPPLERLSDPGFEAGTLSGWLPLVGTTTLSNVTSAPNSHSGSHYLQCVTTGSPEAVLAVEVAAPDEYEGATVGIWFYADMAIDPLGVISVQWLDADGSTVEVEDLYASPFTKVVSFETASGGLVAGWNHLQVGRVVRPEGGVTLQFGMYVSGNLGSDPYTFRFDDASIIFDGPTLDDFTMEATNQYEWRVQATDTDYIESDWSDIARFWVVPAPASGGVRPLPTGTVAGAELGCGTHKVFVYRRGGRTRVGEIKNISHLDWGRTRDDISTSQIVISGWDIDCGNLLAKLQTWAYEVVIFRDNGYSTDRVWEGPVTLLTYESDKVTIEAKDVMAYAYRRIIKQKMSDAGTGNGTTVVDRARRVLQNTIGPDDPNILAYLQVLAQEDDAMQYRSTPAYSRTAFEEIDDMAANAGLDYTTVGRSILLWGTRHRIGTLPEFKDENLGSPPIVSEYGMNLANRYAVSDGNGVYGEATRLDEDGNDEIYGLVEMLSSTWASDSETDSGTFTEQGLETTRASFRGFAERSIADRYPPPVVVRVPDNTTLNPNTVLSIQHLVPGVVVPLRSTSTLREVVGNQKLDAVKVVEENGKETITITLSPFNHDDATPTEGEGA